MNFPLTSGWKEFGSGVHSAHVLCMCNEVNCWAIGCSSLSTCLSCPPFAFFYSLFLRPYTLSFVPDTDAYAYVRRHHLLLCLLRLFVIMHSHYLPNGLYMPYLAVLLHTYTYIHSPSSFACFLALCCLEHSLRSLCSLLVLLPSNWSNIIPRPPSLKIGLHVAAVTFARMAKCLFITCS